MAEPKGTTEKLSLTVPRLTKNVVDKLLTPVGFFEPPKGAYSSLVSTLLQDYLERSHGVQIIDLFDYYGENPDATFDEARDFFTNRAKNA
jgi:hypothetical protein